MKVLTCAILLLLSTGCMKDVVGGMGFGQLNDRSDCAANVVESYERDMSESPRADLKGQYEIAFNCKMEGM